MPNIIYGPFAPINVVNGTTPANATWGNLVQTQSDIALHGFNPDLLTSGFVLSGLQAWKDGVTANQLDVATGSAYVVFTNGTIGLISCPASTQTTSALSTTYHLYLQPDGTFYWNTLNSPATNSLAIANVTTDGAGNISGVTDQRNTSLKMLSGAAGSLQLPAPLVSNQTQNGEQLGSVIGGVTFGVVGAIKASYDTAATFNGTTGYISIPITTNLPSGNANWSVECWFKCTTLPASGTNAKLVNFGNFGAGAKDIAGLYVHNNAGTGEAWGGTGGGGNDVKAGNIVVNTLYHLVATWDGSTLSAYLNAGTPGTLALTGVSIGASVANIGHSNNLGTVMPEYFTGMIDEVAIYASTLSPTRITSHFNAASSTTSDSYKTTILADAPVAYYRLGEPVGSSTVVSTAPATPTTIIDAGGTVKNVGGQASAGGLGVPVIIAQAINVPVQATGAFNIINVTAPATALYRLSASLTILNSGAQLISMAPGYTDPNLNSVSGLYFDTASATVIVLNGASLTGPRAVAILPQTFYAKAGTAIQLQYLNGTGTPNDRVTGVLERLT